MKVSSQHGIIYMMNKNIQVEFFSYFKNQFVKDLFFLFHECIFPWKFQVDSNISGFPQFQRNPNLMLYTKQANIIKDLHNVFIFSLSNSRFTFNFVSNT